MAVLKAKGQITIIDQNDALSIQTFIASNHPLTQIFTQDNGSYVPDWASSPFLVLTPQLFISGIPGDSISTPGRIKAGSAQWRKDDVILTNGGDYTIQGVAPFSLTVKKNENVGGGNVKFTFSAVFVDPNNGLELPFSTVISFNTVMNSGSALTAIITPEQGTVFQNDDISSLSLTADLYRASELLTANVAYSWAVRDGGVFAPTTAGSAASAGQKNVTFASTTNVLPGSEVTIGGNTYSVESVNTSSKVVTMTTDLSTAVASGAAITCPHHHVDFGAGWAKISASAYFNGVTGYTSKTLVVPHAAVLNVEVFKVLAKDNSSGSSTSGQAATAVTTLNDLSDPVYIEISSPAGDVIKNGQGSITVTAEVWRGGEEIDLSGTQYNYTWIKYNQAGTLDGSFSKSGKTIVILPTDITGKATFVCRLMTID